MPCPCRLTCVAQPGSPVTVESQLDQKHIVEPNFDEPTQQALFTVICHLGLVWCGHFFLKKQLKHKHRKIFWLLFCPEDNIFSAVVTLNYISLSKAFHLNWQHIGQCIWFIWSYFSGLHKLRCYPWGIIFCLLLPILPEVCMKCLHLCFITSWISYFF